MSLIARFVDLNPLLERNSLSQEDCTLWLAVRPLSIVCFCIGSWSHFVLEFLLRDALDLRVLDGLRDSDPEPKLPNSYLLRYFPSVYTLHLSEVSVGFLKIEGLLINSAILKFSSHSIHFSDSTTTQVLCAFVFWAGLFCTTLNS